MFLHRMEVTKLLHLAEKEVISSPNAKCNNDKEYNPDREMTSLITKKIKCNLPWSNLQMDQFDDCKTEEEFENYLKEIIEEQEAIERIPQKCQYKMWTLTHWVDVSRDGNTSVNVGLLSTEDKYVHFQITVHLFQLYLLIFCRSILKSKFMYTL